MRIRGRGVRRESGKMNGLETQYALYLERLKLAGEVLYWEFDSLKLRLADKTFYTPDFLVMTADSSIEIHEVKGFWEDDARVKIKVAADKFPFKFLAVRRVGGTWVREEF